MGGNMSPSYFCTRRIGALLRDTNKAACMPCLAQVHAVTVVGLLRFLTVYTRIRVRTAHVYITVAPRIYLLVEHNHSTSKVKVRLVLHLSTCARKTHMSKQSDRGSCTQRAPCASHGARSWPAENLHSEDRTRLL